ncbi:Protein SCO1 -like protein, mitochondrial [Trichinella pseudospiralis]|uniref:Protein SCO1-like protein, mitochondrial n=1 Tax=Trichinella pseudospiralis TaxID=6337 RepID=A0A0V1FSV0_TRIPS|nr:Protein SCO1 -like protein, mitochondrial [Trichinella pseudospiralis]
MQKLPDFEIARKAWINEQLGFFAHMTSINSSSGEKIKISTIEFQIENLQASVKVSIFSKDRGVSLNLKITYGNYLHMQLSKPLLIRSYFGFQSRFHIQNKCIQKYVPAKITAHAAVFIKPRTCIFCQVCEFSEMKRNLGPRTLMKVINLEKKRIIGKSLIGGSWELVNHYGQPVKSEDFQGQWLLIYFGFTHCPDVCPDEIEKMCKIISILDKDKEYAIVKPLFVSVDPERDDPAAVKSYVEEFSPKLLGLTGSEEQVNKICKAFRVYRSQGPRDQDDDYIVDHTIIMYLVNPEGAFVDYYGQSRNAEEIANAIRTKMIIYETQSKLSGK